MKFNRLLVNKEIMVIECIGIDNEKYYLLYNSIQYLSFDNMSNFEEVTTNKTALLYIIGAHNSNIRKMIKSDAISSNILKLAVLSIIDTTDLEKEILTK